MNRVAIRWENGNQSFSLAAEGSEAVTKVCFALGACAIVLLLANSVSA